MYQIWEWYITRPSLPGIISEDLKHTLNELGNRQEKTKESFKQLPFTN